MTNVFDVEWADGKQTNNAVGHRVGEPGMVMPRNVRMETK
jgi:hypothetical protein